MTPVVQTIVSQSQEALGKAKSLPQAVLIYRKYISIYIIKEIYRWIDRYRKEKERTQLVRGNGSRNKERNGR